MFKKNIDLTTKNSSTNLLNIKLKKYSDSKLVAKEILKGNVVLLNLSFIEPMEAIRSIDFLTGVLFSKNGSFKKIGDKNYLLALSNDLIDMFINKINEVQENS